MTNFNNPNSNTEKKLFEYNNNYKIDYHHSSLNNILIISPVILSDFNINIFSHLKFKHSISYLKNIKSKVLLTEVKLLNNNSEILIKGYIEKYDLIVLKNKPFKKIFRIPFSSINKVKYSTPPINYDTIHTDTTIFSENLKKADDYKINIDLNYIKLYEENLSLKENLSSSLLLVKINIRLIQKQEFPIDCSK